MGLKGVPGLRYLNPSEKPEGQAGAGRPNTNASKRRLEEDYQDHSAHATRRTAHQGMPGIGRRR